MSPIIGMSTSGLKLMLETTILTKSGLRFWDYPEDPLTVWFLLGHSLSTKTAFESLPNAQITSIQTLSELNKKPCLVAK